MSYVRTARITVEALNRAVALSPAFNFIPCTLALVITAFPFGKNYQRGFDYSKCFAADLKSKMCDAFVGNNRHNLLFFRQGQLDL